MLAKFMQPERKGGCGHHQSANTDLVVHWEQDLRWLKSVMFVYIKNLFPASQEPQCASSTMILMLFTDTAKFCTENCTEYAKKLSPAAAHLNV
jgi:hypothetical protein